jgi:hypothetical protein
VAEAAAGMLEEAVAEIQSWSLQDCWRGGKKNKDLNQRFFS